MVSSEDSARPRWGRAAALLIAISFGAAACGASDAGSSAAPTLAPAPASDSTAESSSAEGSTEDVGPAEAEGAETGADEGDGASAEPIVNLFPDVDVLSVADGTTVNLAAELGGGDKATLLWFWAPH